MYTVTPQNLQEMLTLELELESWLMLEWDSRKNIFQHPSTEYKATKRCWMEIHAALIEYSEDLTFPPLRSV